MILEDLISKARAASVAYYNTGVAIMEDAEYDLLCEEIKRLDPENAFLKEVGAPTENSLLKVPHTIPMGSLNKALNREDYDHWCENSGLADTVRTASLKADGGSYSFTYVDGNFVQALTRGDGIIGEDVTSNARKFQQLPQKLTRPLTITVRGETVLHTDDWKEVDPDLTSNPRNVGNGIARRKDGTDAELLRVLSFRVHDENGEIIGKTQAENLKLLEELGFTPVPSFTGTAEEIWTWFEKIQSDRKTLPYWIDGIVVAVDDIENQIELGENDQRPKGMVAIKFASTGVTTILRSVELTVGHTGAIIPTAKFDEVRLGGTTVSSALLCNWGVIEGLDIAIGDEIEVIKAGDIIPRIVRVTKRTCQKCGTLE